MKRCPTCDAPAEGDALFCEVDGTRLVRETSEKSSDACPGCGAVKSDDGDGYCASCGLRLPERLSAPMLPTGSRIAGFLITATGALDDREARGPEGPVLLVLGDRTTESSAAAEHAALTRLGGDPRFPRVLQDITASEGGPAFVLSSAPGRPLTAVGPSLEIGAVIHVVRDTLSLAEAIEAAGLAWTPSVQDFHLDDAGALSLSRLRGARRLLVDERLDPQLAFEAIGASLLPSPAVHGPVQLVRLLAHGAPMALGRPRNVDEARKELEAVTRELPVPQGDGRPVAAVCDAGMRRDHNEDASAVASGHSGGEPWTVVVVCDGVSASTHAEQASDIAARAARDALAHFARSGDIAFEAAALAMGEAVRAAHVAICASTTDHVGDDPPGTTIVAALVHRKRLTVGWVGDSRAYWVTPRGGELLTHDHSWVNETIARGEMTEAEAMAAPLAHALTKCLGPLEVGNTLAQIEPAVRTRDLAGPGRLVLCSDGFWNYYSSADDIARLVASAPTATPAGIARWLVNHALAAGGHDNVTVAVYEHG